MLLSSLLLQSVHKNIYIYHGNFFYLRYFICRLLEHIDLFDRILHYCYKGVWPWTDWCPFFSKVKWPWTRVLEYTCPTCFLQDQMSLFTETPVSLPRTCGHKNCDWQTDRRWRSDTFVYVSGASLTKLTQKPDKCWHYSLWTCKNGYLYLC